MSLLSVALKIRASWVVCQYLNITMMGQGNLAQQGKGWEDNLQGRGEGHTGPHRPCGAGCCPNNFQMMFPVCSTCTPLLPSQLCLCKSWPSLRTGSVLPPLRRLSDSSGLGNDLRTLALFYLSEAITSKRNTIYPWSPNRSFVRQGKKPKLRAWCNVWHTVVFLGCPDKVSSWGWTHSPCLGYWESQLSETSNWVLSGD